MLTHEQYIQAIRDRVVAREANEQLAAKLAGAKLVYGHGGRKARGRCIYQSWQNGQRHDFIEICAATEESAIQLAGTTVHELAHVLAPNGKHGKEWRAACRQLGLVHAEAKGQEYEQQHFAPALWAAIEQIGQPDDGRPAFGQGEQGAGQQPRPGSRLRLWECKCVPPVKVRVASDSFAAKCLVCGREFEQQDGQGQGQ